MYLFAELGQENIIASLLDFHSNFINWLLLLAILFFVIRKFIPPLIAQRQLSINNELAAAAKTRQDAERALAKQKLQIEQASQAAEKIVVEARQIAKQMSEEMRQQTEQERVDLLKKFDLAVHNERQAAVLEMRTIVARAAIKLAQENMQATLTADNKVKLGHEFMEELSKLSQSNLSDERLKKNSSSGNNHSGNNHKESPGHINYPGSDQPLPETMSSAMNDKNLVDS